MPRLFNRGRTQNTRRDIRKHIMANNTMLRALEYLQRLRVHRRSGMPFSNNHRRIEKKYNDVIRNAFRRAGHANVLPLGLSKMIDKLSNVRTDAIRIARERRRAHENVHLNKTHNIVSVPSTRVNYARRTNGGSGGFIVLHPTN